MATYPIKVLKDETGVPFVPLVSSTGITSPDGTTLEDSLSVKLESGNIIAGDNIVLTKNGNDITITGTASGAANKVIDNLTTVDSNVGVLDAHQGYVLNNKITEMAETLEGGIPQVINNCTTVDTVNALSAYQGYLLNNKFNNYLPLEGGSLTGSLSIGGTLTVGSYPANTTDTWIPVINSGRLDHTLRVFATSVQSTNWGTNGDYLPTMDFLSHWNGAYNTSGTSNLSYCNQGAFGAMAANKGGIVNGWTSLVYDGIADPTWDVGKSILEIRTNDRATDP